MCSQIFNDFNFSFDYQRGTTQFSQFYCQSPHTDSIASSPMLKLTNEIRSQFLTQRLLLIQKCRSFTCFILRPKKMPCVWIIEISDNCPVKRTCGEIDLPHKKGEIETRDITP